MKHRRHCSQACSLADQKDRLRALQHGVTYEPVSRWRVFEAAGWACYLCDVTISRAVPFDHPTRATIDHVRPLGRGGSHTIDNVAACCRACNEAKDDRFFEVAA